MTGPGSAVMYNLVSTYKRSEPSDILEESVSSLSFPISLIEGVLG